MENEPFRIVQHDNFSGTFFLYRFFREKLEADVTCRMTSYNELRINVYRKHNDNVYVRKHDGWYHISNTRNLKGFYDGKSPFSREKFKLSLSKDVSSFLEIPRRFRNDVRDPHDVRNHPVWDEIINKAEAYYQVGDIMEM